MAGIRWLDVGYFSAELAVYASVVTWGLTRDLPWAFRWVLAVAGLLTLAASWGLLAAPRASFPLVGAADLWFRCAWFGVGAVATAVVTAEAMAG